MQHAIQPLTRPKPNDPLGSVDPTLFDHMMINGQKVERIVPRACACGGRADLFQTREIATLANCKNIAPSQGGYRINWQSPAYCPSCLVRNQIRARNPNLAFRTYDRGIHRSVLMSAIEWCRSKKTLAGRFEAEVLEDIVGSVQGEWIPSESLSHPHARVIDALVANMSRESCPPDAPLRLGRVEVQRDRDLPIYDREVGPLLDRHARLDHGEHGPAAEPTVEVSWCPVLASIQEMNALALVCDGPIRSLYVRPETTNGREVGIEVITFLRRGSANTLVLIGLR